MRLFWLNILFTLASVIEKIRTQRNGWLDLGKLWYVRWFYSPEHFGLSVDVHYSALDDFEITLDLGPATVAVGRDFVS